MTDDPVHGRHGRSRLIALALLLVALAVLVASGLGATSTPGGGAVTTTRVPSGPPRVVDDVTTPLSERTLGGVRFTDVTDAAGLSQPHSAIPLRGNDGMTAGVAVADVFGTGRLDIFVSRIGLPNLLYRNDGNGVFTDVAGEVGLSGPTVPTGSGPAAFADFSGSGCPDLYVAGADSGRDAFFVNDCHGRFVDRTAERGLVLPDVRIDGHLREHGVTVGDFDHDGDLDLLVLQWDVRSSVRLALGHGADVSDPRCTATRRALAAERRVLHDPTNRSRLFANDGRGNFTDVTKSVGLDFGGIAAFSGQFVDVTGDGWEDLLVTGDLCTSRLFRNDGGRRFVDVTDRAGVGTDENGMGSVVRDLDGDGRPEWLVTSVDLRLSDGSCRWGGPGCSGNRVYRNAGRGRLQDVTDRLGLRDGWWGWGVAAEDFADLGRLDVVQVNGLAAQAAAADPAEAAVQERFATDPARYWVRTDHGYIDAAVAVGFDRRTVDVGLVAFDYDANGSLDLLVTEANGTPHLYRNDRPADRGWLTIRLDDPTRPGNRQGLGSKVVVTQENGRRTTMWVSTDGSYESQKPAELHVGLGDRPRPVRVEVWWPGASRPQRIDDVAPRQILTIERAR